MDERQVAAHKRYVIEGTTSDGESFDLAPNGFDSHDDAVNYAMEYARCVTGTDSIEVERLDTTTVITARGSAYAERLRINL
jgi:hypothetical protein